MRSVLAVILISYFVGVSIILSPTREFERGTGFQRGERRSGAAIRPRVASEAR